MEPPSLPPSPIQASPRRGLFHQTGTYAAWWLLFSLVAATLQPVIVTNGESYEHLKRLQMLTALPIAITFGIVCALVFTLLQNLWNKGRKKSTSWMYVFLVWLGMKFAFIGVVYLLGGQIPH